jgi:membrane protease YdiL (CAAX protease family)
MLPANRGVRRSIGIFLVITFALSSVFYFLIILTGKLSQGLYLMGLMWCPGVAALLSCLILRREVSTLGWKWNARYQFISYLVPLAYCLVAYGSVWLFGWGRFPDATFVRETAKAFGWERLPPGMVIAFSVLLLGTIGFIRSTISALGEEIGWRGFLVPELARKMSFTNTALITGIVWSIWHYPLILFSGYNMGTPTWYALGCFTVMVVGISFAFTWLRLKSGSLWTGTFLHASHNLYVQQVFTPLTADTGHTRYVVDEFGAALAIVALVVAFLFWRRRAEVDSAGNVPPQSS